MNLMTNLKIQNKCKKSEELQGPTKIKKITIKDVKKENEDEK